MMIDGRINVINLSLDGNDFTNIKFY